MKYTLSLLLMSVLLASCGGAPNNELGYPSSSKPEDGTSISSDGTSASNENKVEDQTLLLTSTFVYGHIQEGDTGMWRAPLLWNYSYYSFEVEGEIESRSSRLIAGDRLEITFDGAYDGICLETYPAQCTIEGKIKSSRYLYTYTEDASNEGTDMSLSTYLHACYDFANDYIILDEEGHYVPLEEYEGNKVYVSVDKAKMEEEICGENCMCGVSLRPISAIYAYNPRA